MRVFFGAGIYFSTLSGIMDYGRAPAKESATAQTPSTVRAFVAGATARTLAATLMSPVAVVKTRAEWATGESPYRGALSGMRHIAATEGFAALYSGLLPTLLRDVPFSGVYYALYTRFKNWCVGDACAHILRYSTRSMLHIYTRARTKNCRTDSPAIASAVPVHAARNFSASLGASTLATLLTQPVDVVRTRLQLGAVDGVSSWSLGTVLTKGVTDVVRIEGVLALFTGTLSRVIKRSLSTALTWMLFEEATR